MWAVPRFVFVDWLASVSASVWQLSFASCGSFFPPRAQHEASHPGAAGGNGNDSGSSTILDGAGKILVASHSDTVLGDRDMAIWRLDPDGSFDTSFNGQGWITHGGAAGGLNDDDAARAITLDGSGRIIAAGWSINSAGDEDMVVWRLR